MVSENWHLGRSDELGHLTGQDKVWNAYTIVARTRFFFQNIYLEDLEENKNMDLMEIIVTNEVTKKTQ